MRARTVPAVLASSVALRSARGMPPRTILYTGKGGVGKTSVAAATARRCAAAGLRTVVLSTDPAHSLSDVLGVELGGEPTPAGELLWGQEVQAQAEMERHWSAVRAWLGKLLIGRGVDRISAEELTVPPGMDELFSLLAVKAHVERETFDVVVRRLRADGRDAAAAVVPRRRTLVAGQGLPPVELAHGPRRGRSPAPCSTSRCPTRPCSTRSACSCAT